MKVCWVKFSRSDCTSPSKDKNINAQDKIHETKMYKPLEEGRGKSEVRSEEVSDENQLHTFCNHMTIVTHVYN
jgi:hypothetical protein